MKLLSNVMKISVMLVVCLCLGLTACQPSSVIEPDREEPAVSQTTSPEPRAEFNPEDCWFEVPERLAIRCGYVSVPADHFQPGLDTVQLAVVIIPDQSENHQPDPVFLLAGGPGERVAANALELSQVISAIHPNRDLVIYDQRGVGLSKPALECPQFLEALLDNLDQSDSGEAAKRNYDSLLVCRDRFLEEGINLSVFNTRQSAVDIEALRVALGYDLINLYGASYGSLLAQVAMRDIPQHIRSVAMNSVLPIEKSIFLDTSTTAAHAIMALLHACAEDPACASAYPGLEEELFTVVARLNEAPQPMSLSHPLTGEEYQGLLTGDALVGNLFSFLYISRIIPVLPQAIHNVYAGDYTLMQQLSSTRLALLDELSRGTMLSVLCKDDLIGRSFEDQLALRSTLPDPLVNDIDDEDLRRYGAFGLCENWPVVQDESWVKRPLESEIPTLLLAGEFDPITPPEYARRASQGLLHGYLIEFPGVGHDVLSSTCAQGIAGEFIQSPEQIPQVSCVREMPTVAFDLPKSERQLSLEPFEDDTRGFKGLIPVGWEQIAPANLARRQTALDPAYFVLEVTPGTQAELYARLAPQLALDPSKAPEMEATLGHFAWSFFTFDRGEAWIDLAMSEADGRAYFVLLISPIAEHDQLYEKLFKPAVEAMEPLL